jgi:hypothetical protein
MSELLEIIRSRGYWRVVIRPGSFVERRVSNISALYPLLQNISVQFRGWDFPHLDTRNEPHIDSDWVGQETDWSYYRELWRFYQSGQFVHISALAEDWIGGSSDPAAPQIWKPGNSLSVERTVFRFTETFELASRLALTEAGDEQMHVEILVNGLGGRDLRVDSEKRVPFSLGKKASIKEMPFKVDLSRTQLVTEPRDLALKPALELFRRFGWDPSLEILRDIQGELFRQGSHIVDR